MRSAAPASRARAARGGSGRSEPGRPVNSHRDTASLHGVGLGLGLDVGGSGTRWALADANGHTHAQGQAPAFSAMQMHQPDTAAGVQALLAGLLRDVRRQMAELPGAELNLAELQGVRAGITGVSTADEPAAVQLRQLLADGLGLPPARVWLGGDVELLARSAFAPGQGIVLYAGTGSMAAHVDEHGTFHRAGGRGALLGDEGGGQWIALRALSAVWRAEDQQPGQWRASPMARALFEALGGEDWATTRQRVYQGSRGDLGRLALAVASSAADDPQAAQLLQAAGRELACLARAMQQRCGPWPVLLAGRVWQLHPAIEAAFRADTPPVGPLRHLQQPAHELAARQAAQIRP